MLPNNNQEAVWVAQATLLIDQASKYMAPFPGEIDLNTITPLGVPVSKMVGEMNKGVAGRLNILPLALEYATILHGVLQAAYALGHQAGFKMAQDTQWLTSQLTSPLEERAGPSASSSPPDPAPPQPGGSENPSPAAPPRS